VEKSQLEDKSELGKHRQSMEDLSRLLELPWKKISVIYLQELEIMKHTARIKDFLPIFVTRRVRNVLRHP